MHGSKLRLINCINELLFYFLSHDGHTGDFLLERPLIIMAVLEIDQVKK